jgi:hypothetical protein
LKPQAVSFESPIGNSKKIKIKNKNQSNKKCRNQLLLHEKICTKSF